MRKLIAATLAAAVLGVVMALGRISGSADASVWWCWDDPVLVIDGQVLHIYTGVPSSAIKRVTLADLVITVPPGVDVKMTANNAPRFPQQARLVRSGAVNPDGSIPITATVTVNGHGRFDTAIKITQPGGDVAIAYGASNQPLSTMYTLLPKKTPAPVVPAASERK